MTLDVVSDPTPGLSACRTCPRLVENLASIRAEEPTWHNAPVPWHGDPAARLLVVGLAPGRGGANRTGVPFTGDASGDWLWDALHREKFSDGASAREGRPTLRDAAITNAVKCVPPGNKPSAREIAACRPHLVAEARAFANVRVIVALGRIAHDAWLASQSEARGEFPFAHGAIHRLASGVALLDSFHPSPLNTRTGRLTRAAWNRVWTRAARLARESWHVYLLRCGDGTLYTGITTDLARRHAQHASGKGARYTRSRGAREILWSESVATKSEALKREYAVKQLTRAEKLRLAKSR